MGAPRWSKEHDEAMRILYPTGGWRAVADKTGKSKNAIIGRAFRLGIKSEYFKSTPQGQGIYKTKQESVSDAAAFLRRRW